MVDTTETTVQNTFDKLFAQLSPEEAAGLSKVLFPDTHTTHVDILGKRRELKPLVIKWSKKLRAVMQPWAKKLDDAVKNPDAVDLDTDLVSALSAATLVLCEAYGPEWNDIREALAVDEVPLKEIQELAAVQTQLQGEHDFLVLPLRVALMVMRSVEIQQRRYQSIFSGSQPAPS